jgi:hypothetical protein
MHMGNETELPSSDSTQSPHAGAFFSVLSSDHLMAERLGKITDKIQSTVWKGGSVGEV